MNEVSERFWSKVGSGTDADCWLWKGARITGGYGSFRLTSSEVVLAHRLSYQLFKDFIPKGFEIDHLCRNRACVNPEHLEAVTSIENITRSFVGMYQRVKTHCPKGHPYSGTNLGLRHEGKYVKRMCKECNRAKAKRWRLKMMKTNGNV